MKRPSFKRWRDKVPGSSWQVWVWCQSPFPVPCSFVGTTSTNSELLFSAHSHVRSAEGHTFAGWLSHTALAICFCHEWIERYATARLPANYSRGCSCWRVSSLRAGGMPKVLLLYRQHLAYSSAMVSYRGPVPQIPAVLPPAAKAHISVQLWAALERPLRWFPDRHAMNCLWLVRLIQPGAGRSVTESYNGSTGINLVSQLIQLPHLIFLETGLQRDERIHLGGCSLHMLWLVPKTQNFWPVRCCFLNITMPCHQQLMTEDP